MSPFKHPSPALVLAATLSISIASPALAEPGRVLRAGAHAIDITPEKLPVRIAGGFLEATADKITDRLHARCIVLDDGAMRIAIAVADSCMMPRELLDEAKELARQKTGIPPDRILISATHTHSTPAAMGCLGCPVEPGYAKWLPGRIAEGIERAAANLEPARAGRGGIDAPAHTHNRRWIYRPDKMLTDPFGGRTVRANMHPGYQNPDAIGPSGPVDPGLSFLSIEALDGRPIAVLANYSMHYFGAEPVSTDYYGRFAEKLTEMIKATQVQPPFVAAMSQGTSGDQMWMDYGMPRRETTLDDFAGELAAAVRAARTANVGIEHREGLDLAMAESKLMLRRRTPDEARLAWARDVVAKMQGRKPASIPEVYALEQIYLHDEPVRELKLQAIRIGDLGIAAIPNEVFAITGLKLKAMSPLERTFTIELANGAEGYIPPPEQHKLGGYTTWPARTAGLEPEAEPKIVDVVLALLEKVSSKPRRGGEEPAGAYAKAVLASKPIAYWRLGELAGPRAADSSGNGNQGAYEDGVALGLRGPDAQGLFGGTPLNPTHFIPRGSSEPTPPWGALTSNRCAHFAGGRVTADVKGLGAAYSIELWFWNGLPDDAREITGWIVSRTGESLGIGGENGSRGKLVFAVAGATLVGARTIELKTWHHVVIARDGRKVAVYLDGHEPAEISGELPAPPPVPGDHVFIGGRLDGKDNFEGKLDEVAVYGRVLTVAEAAAHEKAADREK